MQSGIHRGTFGQKKKCKSKRVLWHLKHLKSRQQEKNSFVIIFVIVIYMGLDY